MCSSIQSSSFNSLPLSVLFVQLVAFSGKKNLGVIVPCVSGRVVHAPDRDFIVVCAPLSFGIQ